MKLQPVLCLIFCSWNVLHPSWGWIINMEDKEDPVDIDSVIKEYYRRLDHGTRGTGTTPDLKQKLISRCQEYQTLHKEFFKTGVLRTCCENEPAKMFPGKRDCNKIYDMFESAFKYKEGCGVNVDSVIKFIDMTNTDLPKDKLLFWSKTYDLAQKYSNKGANGFTLESTFTGYILDGLNFCGQKDGHGINYNSCPHWKSCKGDHPLSAFWTLASKKFASKARGRVRALLNGSLDGKKPAFSSTSILANQEIPNLNCKEISNVDILLVHEPRKQIVDKCGSGSLVLLANTLKQRGCTSTCTDDPKALANKIG